MDELDLKKQEEELVSNLILVKEEYVKMKEQLAVSLRKDVLLIELKDMLNTNTDFFSLKNAIEEYIIKLEGEINGKSNSR